MKNRLIVWLLILLPIFSFCQLPGYVPSSGLISFYEFDQALSDLGPAGVSGNLSPAISPVWSTDRFGNPNSSIRTGTYFVDFPNNQNHKPLNAISVSVWMRLEQSLGANSFPLIVVNRSGSINAYVVFGAPTGTLNAQISNAGTATTSSLLGLNQWRHVVVTYQSGDYRLYVDGNLIQTRTDVNGLINYGTGTGNLRVGSIDMSAGNLFNGSIDEVGLWNRVLSPTEVTALFTSTTPCIINNFISGTSNYCSGSEIVLNNNFSTSGTLQNIVWLKDGQMVVNNASISGATTSTLVINNAQTSNGGIYRMVVNSSCGADTSLPFQVNVVQGTVKFAPKPALTYPLNNSLNGLMTSNPLIPAFGSATFANDRFGVAQGALNKNSNVQAFTFQSPIFANNMSASIWINFNNYTNTSGGIIFDNMSGSVYHAYIDMNRNLSIYNGSNFINTNYQFPANGWVHLILASNGQWNRIYINGNQIFETFQGISPINSATGINSIGGTQLPSIRFLVDDFRIYTKFVTPEEASAIYNDGFEGPYTTIGLVGTANCVGGSSTLSFTLGSSAVTQQFWKRAGVPVSGSRFVKGNNSLTINNLILQDSANYVVEILNGCAGVKDSATVSVNTAPDINNGLVRHYLLNNPATSGTLVGSGTFVQDRFSLASGAYSQSSPNGSFLSIPSFGGNTVSVSFWLRPTQAPGPNGVVFFTSGLPTLNIPLVTNFSGTYCVYTNGNFIPSSAGLQYNQWQHVVWTANGTNHKIYLNGNLILNTNGGFVVASNAIERMFNGQAPNTAGQGAVGSFDDVRMYNREISQIEVQALYNLPNISNQSNVVSSCVGSGFSMFVSAQIQPVTTLNYQWYKGNQLIQGATSATYSKTASAFADSGQYFCRVFNGSCSYVQSQPITLNVTSGGSITFPPSLIQACQGSNVSLMMTGGQFYRYTDTTYLPTLSNTAQYNFIAQNTRKVIAIAEVNGCNYSDTIQINVIPIPNVQISASPSTLCAGSSSNLTASGANTYTWLGGLGIGATQSVSPANTTTYNVIGTGNGNCIDTTQITIQVNPLPAVSISGPDTICAGANAVLTASGAMSYTWANGLGNNNSVTVIPSNTSVYTVTGTSLGCSTSVSKTVFVRSIPTISITGNSSVCAGVNYLINSAINGNVSQLQWKLNNQNIAGATSSNLNLNNIQSINAGNYSLTGNSSCGNIVSNTLALTVNSTTVINTQPQASTVCAGNAINLSISASGTALTYQWRKGGASISGATNANFSIPTSVVADAGNYDVVVSGTCGTVTSQVAAVAVLTSPQISTQPQNIVLCENANASFAVVAQGSGLGYQWSRNGNAIAGATNATLSLANVNLTQAGNYSVFVTSSCGNITSSSATLTVNSTTVINTQPQASTVCAGNAVNLSISASGTALTYQWRKGGASISGATNANFSIPTSVVADAGNYDVVVSGTCGTVTSQVATVSIDDKPEFTFQPISEIRCQGDTLGIMYAFTGNALQYEWIKNQQVISTSPTLMFLGIQLSDSGNYQLGLGNQCGFRYSNNFQVNVNPSYENQLSAQICQGDSFLFVNQYVYQSGNYTANFNSISGCDSIVNLQLQVIQPIINTELYEICSGDTLFYNQSQLTISGNYTFNFVSQAGCDSIVNLVLIVNQLPLVEIVESGNVLTATTGLSNYEWFKDGVSYQQGLNILQVTETGLYKVYAENTATNCGNYSNEILVDVTSIDIRMGVNIQVYPNPASQFMVISGLNSLATIALFDYTGKLIFETKSNESVKTLNTDQLPTGRYIVKIVENNHVTNIPVQIIK